MAMFGAICPAFAIGATLGAFATKAILAYSLAIPVAILLAVLLRCQLRAPVMKDERRQPTQPA